MSDYTVDFEGISTVVFAERIDARHSVVMCCVSKYRTEIEESFGPVRLTRDGAHLTEEQASFVLWLLPHRVGHFPSKAALLQELGGILANIGLYSQEEDEGRDTEVSV